MNKITQLLGKMKHYKIKKGYSILLEKEDCDICIEALENDKKIYNKAIDDFAEKISKYGTYDDYGNVIDILEIAEQVKAGEVNG